MIKRHENIGLPFGILLTCVLIATLSACARTGIINGQLNSGPTVRLHYHRPSGHLGGGTMTAVMPNGERFTGKYVIGSTSTIGIGVGAGSGGPGVFTGGGNTSNASAVLIGDTGGSMHCSFTLSKPDRGLSGGGVGHCKLSTGQVINAIF